VDRSTEPQGTLVTRAACYHDHYRRGGFARHVDAPRTRPPDGATFRLLFIFKSHQRRDNTAARLLLLQPPILSQAWLTTYDEVIKDPLGPIWLRPIDFRNAARTDRPAAMSHRLPRKPPTLAAPFDTTPRKLRLIERHEPNLQLGL
jgi:hypothetical protein